MPFGPFATAHQNTKQANNFGSVEYWKIIHRSNKRAAQKAANKLMNFLSAFYVDFDGYSVESLDLRPYF